MINNNKINEDSITKDIFYGIIILLVTFATCLLITQ